jgi:hypothetical protein
MPKPHNPQIYVLRLRARPGTDAIKSLRAALKILHRSFGLQAISIVEETTSCPTHQTNFEGSPKCELSGQARDGASRPLRRSPSGACLPT